MKRIFSPLIACLICAPAWLPNFYVWEADFNDGSNFVLLVLRIIGIVAKYFSPILLVACVIRLRVINTKLIASAALFLAALLAATATNLHGIAGLREAISQFTLCIPIAVYFALLIRFGGKEIEKYTSLFRCLWVLMTAVCVITLLLYIVYPDGIGPLFGVESQRQYGRMRNNFLGIHEETPLYALSYIVLSIIFGKLVRSKAIPVGGVILGDALMFWSTSMTAVILAVVLTALSIVWCFSPKPGKRSSMAQVCMSPWFLIIIFVCLSLALPMILENETVGNFITGVLKRDRTISGRLPMYVVAIDTILHSPLVGIGCSKAYYESILINSYGESMPMPHNSFLQLGMEGGLMLIIVYVSFVYFVIGKNWNARSRSGNYVLLCFVLALLAASMFDDVFSARFSLLLGLVGVINQVSFDECKSKARAWFGSQNRCTSVRTHLTPENRFLA